MDVERETLIKFGTPIAATAVFIALVIAVGSTYGYSPDTNGVALSETGAVVLVALLAVFIVGMAALGALIGDVGGD